MKINRYAPVTFFYSVTSLWGNSRDRSRSAGRAVGVREQQCGVDIRQRWR
jgi:hypothetical protein